MNIKKSILSVALLLLITGQACALTIAQSATCRILCFDGDQGSSNLSGVVIKVDGDQAYAITSAHAFDTGRPSCSVWLPNHDRAYSATILAIGNRRTYDLALVRFTFDKSTRLTAARVAEKTPELGSNCSLVGYPGGGRRQVIKDGRVWGTNQYTIQCSFKAIGGDSGGPVFVNGKVVAIQSSRALDGSASYAVHATALRTWLKNKKTQYPPGGT